MQESGINKGRQHSNRVQRTTGQASARGHECRSLASTKEDNMFRVSLRVPLGPNEQDGVRFSSGTRLLRGTANPPSDRIRRTGLCTDPSHISPYDLWQEIPLVTFNFLGWLGDLLDQWGTVLAAATTTGLFPA
jgi:hypothetical protein